MPASTRLRQVTNLTRHARFVLAVTKQQHTLPWSAHNSLSIERRCEKRWVSKLVSMHLLSGMPSRPARSWQHY
jgi:hypothetical protein